MDKSIVTLVSDVRVERARKSHMFHELLTSPQSVLRALSKGRLGWMESKLPMIVPPTALVEMKEGPKVYTGNPLDIYMNQDTLLGVLDDTEK